MRSLSSAKKEASLLQMAEKYDVLIIGGGVIGSAIARELSRYRLRVAVLEKECDVCCETSAHNSGVLHAGYNNRPGSRMARYCVEGNEGFDRVAEELDIPFRRTGKLVVGFDEQDLAELKKLKAQGEAGGCRGLEIVGRERIKELAPFVEGTFAMYSPMTGILDPFQLTVGLAENACRNGVKYFFRCEVTAIRKEGGEYFVTTSRGVLQGRWVINCAGLYADRLAGMLGLDDYRVHPCRGEYFVLDQRIGPMLPLPAYPVPNIRTGGLGIHLTPTVDGNITVGPSAEYIDERDDYAVTKEVLDSLIREGSRIFPYLKREHFIRNFAGIRPKLTDKSQGGYHDFVIESRPEHPRVIHLIGIESPGLTSCLPIAREVAAMLREAEDLLPREDFDPVRKRPVCFRDLSDEERAALVAGNPDYGEIVCRCETITRAEVLAAIRNPLGVATVTGVKYRCRAMMGRCQGGYCQLRIAELLMQEHGIPASELTYSRAGSWMFAGKVREG
jgi:glycerol-3-phosphate dehydrogenase